MKDIILKITEKCNSACAYCDVVANKKNARHMSIDVLEVVFKRIDDFLTSHPQEGVNVIWHGGEPLLLSPDFYTQAHQIQCDFCASTMDRITHGMQTNLTLLTEEHLAVLSKFEMSLGTSYDPAPGIRGAGFPNDSRGYNERFHRAAALALRHGLVPGIIYVVTRKSLENPLDIFHFLSNLTNNGAFSMNPVLIYDDRRPDLSITPMEYVDFLGRIFPVWWETSQRYAEVDPFSSLTRIIRDGKMSLACCYSGRCAYSHLNIAPDGTLSHCGRSGDWGLLTYGSILELSLAEAFNCTFAERTGRQKRSVAARRVRVMSLLDDLSWRVSPGCLAPTRQLYA